jgi:hypothetical protein
MRWSKTCPIMIFLLTVLLVTASTLGMPLPATLPHPPATQAVLWSQAEAPASVELCVPEALVNALLTEESPSHAIDLRVPEVLLRHVYGAGRVSKSEKSPAP